MIFTLEFFEPKRSSKSIRLIPEYDDPWREEMMETVSGNADNSPQKGWVNLTVSAVSRHAEPNYSTMRSRAARTGLIDIISILRSSQGDNVDHWVSSVLV